MVIVKRYAATRLYNTAEGRYVSIEQLKDWRAQGRAFRVIDIETDVDVTDVLIA